jgi:hypothetical protein
LLPNGYQVDGSILKQPKCAAEIFSADIIAVNTQHKRARNAQINESCEGTGRCDGGLVVNGHGQFVVGQTQRNIMPTAVIDQSHWIHRCGPSTGIEGTAKSTSRQENANVIGEGQYVAETGNCTGQRDRLEVERQGDLARVKWRRDGVIDESMAGKKPYNTL